MISTFWLTKTHIFNPWTTEVHSRDQKHIMSFPVGIKKTIFYSSKWKLFCLMTNEKYQKGEFRLWMNEKYTSKKERNGQNDIKCIKFCLKLNSRTFMEKNLNEPEPFFCHVVSIWMYKNKFLLEDVSQKEAI